MKSLRKLSLTLHLWLGLFAAIFLFVEGITGGIMAWGLEILRLIGSPATQVDVQFHDVPPAGTPALSLETLASALRANHPGLRLRGIGFSKQPDLAWAASFQVSSLTSMRVWFDPHTGREASIQATGSLGSGLEVLVDIANRLHRDVAAGLMLLLLALSGLILWWPRKLLLLRRPALSARTNFQLHSAIGFYSSLILVIFSVTSIIMVYSRPATDLVARITHTAPVPSPPPLTASLAMPRGATRLDLDDSMRAAMQILPPHARFTELTLVNNGEVYFFYQPGKGANDQEGLVIVNPMTGTARQQEVPRNFTFAERVVRVQVPDIHTGNFLGLPGRRIAGFFSFLLAFLSVTGPLIWWNRRRRTFV